MYAPTVARVGETVDFLEENGIAAIGYHGQMEAKARRENQEKWMTEEVRVLVGTLAFGLGINKATVRAVIHLSLPKSVEQYYQESGRAGRDGLPADCLLLWQKKDFGLHAYFNNKIADAGERERAWQRYREVEQFVQSGDCRQYGLCRHFGELPKWVRCGQCDACSGVPGWLTLAGEHGEPNEKASRVPSKAGGWSAPSVEEVELREYLREWRRNTAREIGVAAFVVLHDTSLDALCVGKPRTIPELRRISGFGDKKVERYGEAILARLRRFAEGERASKDWHPKAGQPARETLKFLRDGRTLEEIAQIRGRKMSTVVAMVAELVESGETEFRSDWIKADIYDRIASTLQRVGSERLRPVKDALPEEVSYDEIRLVLADLRRKGLAKVAASKS